MRRSLPAGPDRQSGGDADVIEFLKRYLTWWNGATVATRFFSAKNGTEVGRDAEGNVYYRNADGSRRWVIYNGEVEASRIDPDWHGWLHFTFKEAPTDAPLVHKTWEKPHQENLTGTAMAYAPAGSLRQAAPADRRDYEAWQPE